MQFIKALLAAAVLSGLSTMCQAAVYDWSYTFGSGATVAGKLDGTLGADNDTITVNSVSDLRWNGVLSPASFTAASVLVEFIPGYAYPSAPPKVSLSGSFMDLLARDPANPGPLAVLFTTEIGPGGNAVSQLPDGTDFGVDIPFNSQAWSIAETVASVPVPAAGLVLISGLGLLAGLRRRRT